MQRNPDLNWLFYVAKASGLSPCVAFRASRYVSQLSSERSGRRIVSQCNRLFYDIKKGRSTQKSNISPFVSHCLFISIKIETQEWVKNPRIMDFALHNHFSVSHYTNPVKLSSILMEADLMISTAMNWKIIPLSPFQCLEDLFDSKCVKYLNDAIELCTEAVVYEMDVPCARTLACAAVVAAETLRGKQCQASSRALNCFVLLSVAPSAFDAVDYSAVVSLSEELEDLHVKINKGKRKRF